MSAARKIANKLQSVYKNISSPYDLQNTPQQINSYDCAIWVLLTMEHLLLNDISSQTKTETVEAFLQQTFVKGDIDENPCIEYRK